ncbi:TPA: hypothetical protein ACU6JA_005654, partial [Salmonella enterica]
LMAGMMQVDVVVGFFWVIEWMEDHHNHAHVVFWLDGNRTQKTYPWAEKAREYWDQITGREGGLHRCEFKAHYRASINIPVHYSDADSIANIRQVLLYDQNSAEAWPAALRLQRSTCTPIIRETP